MTLFRCLLASPIYDSFHFRALHSDGRLVRWADRKATQRLYASLRTLVEEWRPDVLLPVFPTGVHVACLLKLHGSCQYVIACLPDAAAHRLWVSAGVDLFLVSSSLGAASVRRYWPEAAVRVIDLPLDPVFSMRIDRRQAREQLGVPADKHCVLLMAGGWGLGPLDALAGRLAARGVWVLAVAGRDARLLERLRKAADRYPTIRAFGFCEGIAQLMAASDVVVTTPGMACQEARAVGRRLVLLDLVPGHGRENLLYELSRGHAAWAGSDPEMVARIVQRELQQSGGDPPRLRADPSPFLGAFEDIDVTLPSEPCDQVVGR